MKNHIITVALFCGFPALSQDIIYKHANGQINAKVASINENSITFSYPGETATGTIGKAAVARVQFSSGRIEEISARVDVYARDGWKNVIITSNPTDLVGLRRLGEVKGRAGGFWGTRTVKGALRKAGHRIKRRAAEMGAHVVYLQQYELKGRTWYYSNPESIQAGVAYGY